MGLDGIVAELDAEISRLQQVRRQLAGVPVAVSKVHGASGVILGAVSVRR
jgi:hypothetical protein